MKKLVAFVLVLILIVCFCGCNNHQAQNGDNQQSQDVKLLEEGNVKSVSVTSLPEGYEYSFSGDDAKTVVDYLVNLNLITEFKENPNEYVGMTWVISLEYENGDTTIIYHFGNMFIRTESGPWYQMTYEEASRFDALLNELNN